MHYCIWEKNRTFLLNSDPISGFQVFLKNNYFRKEIMQRGLIEKQQAF